MSDEQKTQFSIYKINLDLVGSVLDLKKKKVDKTELAKVCDIIINSVIVLINKKRFDNYYKVKHEDFFGIIFKTVHEPVWKNIMKSLLEINEIKMGKKVDAGFITNLNISYVLLYMKSDCIYAMTGGYGSSYINKFIEKNYGLYLIPKIINKDYPVIKKVMENNLIGNRFSTERLNRHNTTIHLEQDLSSVYKELNIQVGKEIADLYGITFNDDEAKNKKLSIINKDSVIIRRSLSIMELKKVISNLNKIENMENKFALNYLVFVKKKGIKEKDLNNVLVNCFKGGNIKEFIIAGDNFESYYFNASSYFLLKDDGMTSYIEKDEPIELDDIFEKFKMEGIKLTNTFINNFIKKWTIKASDNAGNLIFYPVSVFNLLQGFIEYGKEKQVCYLINGQWYIIDEKYKSILDDEYKFLYNKKQIEAKKLKYRFRLGVKAKNETKYNEKFKNNKNIIYAHTTEMDNVEIADLIFYDENLLYLMHNKGTFNGIGTRDLTNQILTSSEYLQKRLYSDRGMFLREYYNKLCKKNNVKELLAVTEEEFIALFEKRICFIAGYLKEYKEITKSTYARYLTIELERKLTDKGQILIPMGIGE